MSAEHTVGPAAKEKVRWGAVVDTLMIAVLLWVWALPAAFCWTNAVRKDILLPHLPRLVWVGPGTLWHEAPALFLLLLIAVPLAYFAARRRKRMMSTAPRLILLSILLIIALVNLIWGSAV